MDKVDMIFELSKSLNDKQDKQSEVLTRVEADLKYHIKRTNLIERALDTKADKINYRKVGLILGIIGTIIGIAASFKVL